MLLVAIYIKFSSIEVTLRANYVIMTIILYYVLANTLMLTIRTIN